MKFDFMFPTNLAMPFGAEGENGDQGANGGQQDNGGSDGGASNQGTGSGQGAQGGQQGAGKPPSPTNDGDDDDDDAYSGYTAKELKRALKDMADSKAAADKIIADAQAEKDKADRAKKDEVTNLTEDLQKANNEIASLKATLAKQAVLGAIRDDTRFVWHKPEMVAEQLNSDVVKVDSDGKVVGMKSELTRIAKDFPFLVKSQENGGDKNNGRQQQQNNGPTGFQPGQGGTSSGGGSDAASAKLAENYPALASRS